VNQRGLAEVLLAVAGVCLIVARLPELGIGIAIFLHRDESAMDSIHSSGLETLSFVVPILSALVGALLLMLRQRLAGLLFPRADSDPSAFSISELQGALFAVIGAYLAVRGMAHLVQGAFAQESHASPLSLWPSYAGSIFELATGMALFFGARGLAGVWSASRHAGRKRSTREGAD
jgi:hypothetical protein